MTDHPSIAAGSSQCAIILAILSREPGTWVPMPLLGVLSGSRNVHCRIADLSKRGHAIENRQYTKDRVRHSFYRLIPAPEPQS